MRKGNVIADNWKKFLISGMVVAILVLLPLVVNIGTYILSLLIILLIYIILAQSWNLVAGYAGQFNLGLAAYFGSGVLGYSMLYSTGMPFYAAMLAGGVVAIVLAVIIGIPTLRLRGIYFAIGTLALAEALNITVNNLFPMSMYAPASHWASFSVVNCYYLGLGLACVTMAVAYMVVNSPVGLALRAIRDDEDPAEAVGINPTKYKLLVFIISSFLAGLAGGVFGFYQGIIYPYAQFAPAWTFGPLLAACIGGLGTLTGPIWGGIFFVILQELFSHTVGQAHFIVSGIIFILVILFLPGGLVQAIEMIRRFLGSCCNRRQEFSTSS